MIHEGDWQRAYAAKFHFANCGKLSPNPLRGRDDSLPYQKLPAHYFLEPDVSYNEEHENEDDSRHEPGGTPEPIDTRVWRHTAKV